MAIKSLALCAVVFIISFTSTESSFLCDIAKLDNVQCTTCDFLTFGQEDIGFGISLACPFTTAEESYCCYNLRRQPFCCDSKTHLINGIFWIAAALLIIYGVIKIVKCLFNS